jgi:hypothetical protein
MSDQSVVTDDEKQKIIKSLLGKQFKNGLYMYKCVEIFPESLEKTTYDNETIYFINIIYNHGFDLDEDLNIISYEPLFISCINQSWRLTTAMTDNQDIIYIKGIKILKLHEDIEYGDYNKFRIELLNYPDHQIIRFMKINNTDTDTDYSCIIDKHEYNLKDIVQINQMIYDPAYYYVELNDFGFEHPIRSIFINSDHDVCELIIENKPFSCLITRKSPKLQVITFQNISNDVFINNNHRIINTEHNYLSDKQKSESINCSNIWRIKIKIKKNINALSNLCNIWAETYSRVQIIKNNTDDVYQIIK